ncbi:hypothetical protein [Mesoterricola silvestris]|uniref:Uncharacterized protein n=1 Tax=Mesoterricola silvestris TaxID=2927979 RepID=A0AA48KA50_9BACT|nr:hypothetical protein [Mesoterricola silvestris]BDU71168.1 hypothetical protein METEAL_03420 [Mesoterricola silvestris]
METLRALLVQRAARLQEWPAVSAPGWGTLKYPAFRNRVEGVALGLMAAPPPRVFSRGAGPWDWACEVACASCGLLWDPAGEVDPGILGGPRFNREEGRQPYHDCDPTPETPFTAALAHAGLLAGLRRLNGRLGWDHDSAVTLPLGDLGTPEVRTALWSALYAGAHAILMAGPVRGWDPTPFAGLF